MCLCSLPRLLQLVPASVTVNGAACTGVKHAANHTQLTCALPQANAAQASDAPAAEHIRSCELVSFVCPICAVLVCIRTM